jgi:MFS family permease
MSLLVEDIKGGLGLDQDWQVSILMGPAFAIFYAVFGFPLGRLADGTSRRGVIAVGLTCWSLVASGCGVAKNFVQMALLRIGVGVGEASLSPAAYSMITDSFPKNRVATALSVYGTGIYIGSGMAFLMGGAAISFASTRPPWELPLFGTIQPWQQVFIIVGLAGLVGVPLLYTLQEPWRRGVRTAGSVPTREVVAYIGSNWKTFACHNLGFALLSFSSYGSGAWIPAFYIRRHGWTQGEVALRYGLIVMIAGTLGIACGGRVADWLASRDHRDSKMRLGLIAAVVWAPFGMLYPLVGSDQLSLLLLIPSVFTASMPFGVAPAAIQEMMPNQMRGQASALYLFVTNIIGLAIGPTALALISDYIFGQANVHLSLVWVATVAHILAALLLWRGLKPFVRSLDRLESWRPS